jgi:4-amino-4-deoxy-L-arabinose transferase-like glycosyltransferase
VILVAAAVYLGCIVSPPSLMDDVDAVQAQISRNMLDSGDWVTARLDGVVYLEKAPLIYWAMAIAYKIFGVHDWAARVPIVLSAILLAWLTAAFGTWAFGKRAGMYSGLVMATCFGLWLFTRILIPDVMLTASVALSMWAFLRAIDDAEPHPRWWAFALAASLGTSLLFKSLVTENLEANPAPERNPYRSADRGAVARAGGHPQPSGIRFHHAQRARRISRVPVVLLHQ